MKVLFINSVCGFGSTGKIVVDLYNFCNNKGAQSLICYGRKNNNLKNINSIKISNSFLTLINVLFARIFDNEGLNSHISTIKLIKIIEKNKPDIIHLNNIHGYYLNFKMLFNYLKKCETPIVWTLHDCWAFTGHCAHYDYVKCNKWESGCYKCTQKHTYPVSLIFDRSKSAYKDKKEIFTRVKDMTIVTPSEWLAGEVKKSFLSSYPIKVINNGVDLNKFCIKETDLKNRLGVKDKKIILGICFNLYDMKGGKYLVELSKLLKADEHMVILGLSTKEKLPENITVLPKTNSVEQLAEIYSMANVFVNTTLQDTFPTVNIESLACGTPVVTFDSGGSAEIIDENTGYKVSKGDVTAMYEKIKIILADDRKIYRENCRKRAEKLYCENERFNEYIKMYEKLSY